MTVTVPFEQLLAEMSEAERVKIDVRTADFLAEVDGLAGPTQGQIAETLTVKRA